MNMQYSKYTIGVQQYFFVYFFVSISYCKDRLQSIVTSLILLLTVFIILWPHPVKSTGNDSYSIDYNIKIAKAIVSKCKE